jgi:hypothetical protein
MATRRQHLMVGGRPMGGGSYVIVIHDQRAGKARLGRRYSSASEASAGAARLNEHARKNGRYNVVARAMPLKAGHERVDSVNRRAGH